MPGQPDRQELVLRHETARHVVAAIVILSALVLTSIAPSASTAIVSLVGLALGGTLRAPNQAARKNVGGLKPRKVTPKKQPTPSHKRPK